jgi:hypothetical protein
MRHQQIAEALRKGKTNMKHFLNKKNKIMGAGWNPFSKPKPPKPRPPDIIVATLKPPKLGNTKVMASYDFLEVLELISDGPIEGLVNKNGSTLSQLSLFQGVYLDGTAVLETNDTTVAPKAAKDSGEESVSLTRKSIGSNIINNLSSWIAEIQSVNVQQPDQALNIGNDRKDFNPIVKNNQYLADELQGSDFQNYFSRSTNQGNMLFFVGNGDLERRNVGTPYSYLVTYKEQIGVERYPAIKANRKLGIKRREAYDGPIYRDSFSALRYNYDNGSKRVDLANNFTGIDLILNRIKALAINYPDTWQGKLAEKTLKNNFGNAWSTVSSSYIIRGSNHVIIIPIEVNDSFTKVSLLNDQSIGADGNPLKDANGNVVPRTMKNILAQFVRGQNVVHDYRGQGDGFNMENVILPIIDENGDWQGKAIGFSVIKFDEAYHQAKHQESFAWKTKKAIAAGKGTGVLTKNFASTIFYGSNSITISKTALSVLSQIDNLNIVDEKYAYSTRKVSNLVDKYNYSNIFVEMRNGEEYQTPMSYFNNIMFDHFYSVELFGPFRLKNQIQRLNAQDVLYNPNPNITTLNIENDINGEGSNDQREVTSNLTKNNAADFDYSRWNKTDYEFDEVSIPTTHVVVDPNVEEVFVSVEISSLMDTVTADIFLETFKGEKESAANGKTGAGSPIPAIVVFEIQTGYFDNTNKKVIHESYKFQIISLIQSSCHIDIGNPDLELQFKEYSMITSSGSSRSIYTPFKLPVIRDNNSGKTKRYVQVRKVSCETNSVLVQKKMSLIKVTEITKGNLRYPFSAVIGSKIDGRSFSSVPGRIFDCKLKKVKIPSNYHPNDRDSGKDKRYIASSSNYQKELIYIGDWNGSFKQELEYTDNPAWILYDLLTSQRYGLGSFLQESQIDIWDLYKIGRFCDNVDDAGYFIGVSDGNGGLEPRYSCNILFQEGEKIYDAISIICALFRGSIYYHNSKLNFVDDRVKKPTALFTNANVKGGDFNYTNNKRDEQFNVVEVAYIDRFENFETKMELAEDQEDIRKRGVFKTTINAMGVTSKSMAKRMAEHVIFSTIKENQSVSFIAGAESLLCRPGDLIMIEDDLKSLSSNFGKILDFNQNEGWIRVTNDFSDSKNNAFITCWIPTGYQTKADLEELALTDRHRLNSFTFNNVNNQYPELTGEYVFDGYLKGFDRSITNNPSTAYLDEQYAFYKGSDQKFCYFSTEFTGWVLGQGDMFNKSNGKVIYGTQDQFFWQANDRYEYDFSASNGRGASRLTNNPNTAGSNKRFRDTGDLTNTYHGISNDDIELSSPSQIVNFVLTGFDNSLEYGCKVFVSGGSINYNLIQFLKLGSVSRFQRKNSDDMIYKVINIKEENPNEYGISASLFNTGKYQLIENLIQENEKTDTYPHTLPQLINGVTYETLTPPLFTQLFTGFDTSTKLKVLNIGWSGDPQSTKIKTYEIKITDPYFSERISSVDNNDYNLLFSTPISQIGNYNIAIKSIGLKTDSVKFYDSEERSTGILILNQELLTSAAKTITFSTS